MLISLHTKRLKLRPIEDSDAAAFLELFSQEENLPYITRSKVIDIDVVKNHISNMQASVTARACLYWGIQLLEDPTVIGRICLWNLNEAEESADIGYEIHPRFKGQGYISEALKVVLKYGFEQMNFKKIKAITHADNQPSIKLLERNGFSFLYPLPEEEKWEKEEDMHLVLYQLNAPD